MRREEARGIAGGQGADVVEGSIVVLSRLTISHSPDLARTIGIADTIVTTVARGTRERGREIATGSETGIGRGRETETETGTEKETE